MYQSKLRSVLRTAALLTLGAALCCSLSACKSKDTDTSLPAGASSIQSVDNIQPTVATVFEFLTTLARAGLDDYEELSDSELETVLSRSVDARTLLIVRQSGGPHTAGTENLLIGLWDDATQSLSGEVTVLRGDNALHSYWEDEDHNIHVLLSNTTSSSGLESGSCLNYFIFDGMQIEQVTQLPQKAFYKGDALADGWQTALLSADEDYWTDLKAVPYPGGTELYGRNTDYPDQVPADTQPRPWLYLGYLSLDGLELAPK